jgi:hypothetical protein
VKQPENGALFFSWHQIPRSVRSNGVFYCLNFSIFSMNWQALVSSVVRGRAAEAKNFVGASVGVFVVVVGAFFY